MDLKNNVKMNVYTREKKEGRIKTPTWLGLEGKEWNMDRVFLLLYVLTDWMQYSTVVGQMLDMPYFYYFQSAFSLLSNTRMGLNVYPWLYQLEQIRYYLI